jgi:hypothetical protein
MKRNLLPLAALLLISFSFFGCDKSTVDPYQPPEPQCNGEDHIYTRSINGFDFNPGSPYYNKAIVNFKLTQQQTACPSLSSSTHLVIQNLTPNTVSFDYNITFLLNAAKWNYQNVAAIAPLGLLDVGEINTNPARIDLGVITIQGANISYN